jgi:hypothetical protein
MCYSPKQARRDYGPAPNPSNTLLIRKDVNSGRQAVIEKGGRSAYRQYVTLLSRPGGYGPAPNPSNTLLIRKGVNSGKQAVIEEEDRSACKQCITFLSRPGIRKPALDPSNTLLFIKALIQEGRLQRERR